MSFKTNKRVARSVTAGLLAASMLLGGMSAGTAFAGDGGGSGSGGGGGTVPGNMSIKWKVKESWAASRAGVEAALTEMGYPVNAGDTNAGTVIDKAINEANADCAASYTGTDDAACRLVAVGIAVSNGKWWSANHIDNKDDWMTAWAAEVSGKTYDYNGTAWEAATKWTDKTGIRNVNTLANEVVTANLGAALRVIVLAKNQPAPPNYTLTITTDQQSANVKAGTAGVVRDVIHASNGGSSIRENVNAEVILHYKGQAQGYAAEQQVSKKVTIKNSGDTTSPDFTPSDFGWNLWADGTYWFDVHVAKQGKMAEAVDTKDEEASETFNLASVRPKNPEKTITKGTSASRMTNTTTITTGTGQGAWEMTISDQINPNGVNYSVDNFRIVDKTDNNRDLSGEFEMKWDKAKNLVTAVRTSDKGVMPADHEVAFSFVVTVSKPDVSKIRDAGSRCLLPVSWNPNKFVNIH